MFKNKKVIISIIVISLFLGLFFLRGVIVRGYVSGKVEKIEERYSLSIDYKGLEMSGLAGVTLTGLSIQPKGQDTLMSAKEISLKLSPFKLLFMKFDTRSLAVEDVQFNFVKGDSLSNYNFLFNSTGKKDISDTGDVGGHNYSKQVDNLFSLLFGVLPKNAQINDLIIDYTYGEYKLRIAMPDLTVARNLFDARIFTTECGYSEQLQLDGRLSDNDRRISARIYGVGERTKFSVPFINFKWGAALQFDTLSFELSGSARKDGIISVKGRASVDGVSIFHERISPDNVILDKGDMDYKVNIGDDFVELDSSSVFTINQLKFSPYFKAQKMSKWNITASLNKGDFPAQQLFSSLPEGLFHNLEGMEVSGDLSYHFYLNIDFSIIDSLKLESVLKPKNFKIVKYGKTDLRRMNGEFEYTAYERGVPVRSFAVGPSNPNFRRLDQISPILQMTVMQSEDGGFFYHNGFLPESIREALATDIKDKKFRRGGSTISMQLVKNVFLSRHKTLARKFEEMLIVWLIENNRLTSKERMFEVYMNVIEWGPMVYGANEAARYYFNKDVRDLSVNESIFLAGIIPSPKRSLNNFTPDGLLIQERMDGYYRLLAGRLRVKGLITESEEAAIQPNVRLSGEAAIAVQKKNEPVIEEVDPELEENI